MAPPNANSTDIKQILQQIQQLQQQMSSMNDNFTGLKQQMDKADLNFIRDKLSEIEKHLATKEESAEEKERLRSVVMIGLPESNAVRPTERAREDQTAVEGVFDELGIETIPVAVYRMGKRDPTRKGARLLKIVLPAKSFQWQLLGEWKRRRDQMRKQPEWQRLLIRPSMTRTELEADKLRREEWRRAKFGGGIDDKNVTERKQAKTP